MKKFILSILIFTMAFGTLGGCMKGDSYPLDSESTASQSSAFSDSEESSSSSSSSASEESSVQPPAGEEIPPSFEYGSDLATSAPIHSRAPENYGTHNTMEIQSEIISQNSLSALKGTFSPVGAPVYNGYEIWTWASLCLQEYFGEPVDLKNKVLSYDVKLDNCGTASSFIVTSPDGQRTNEVSFVYNTPTQSYPGITSTLLENGWMRVSINFFTAYFDTPIIREASEILIMFTNQNCADREKNSVFYIDNMKLTDTEDLKETSEIPVHNPSAYYRKDMKLSIKIAGNRLLSPSYADSAYYLQRLCDALNGEGKVTVTSAIIGNGDIAKQTEIAFGPSGYMQREKVDILFLQGFHSFNDAVALSPFLEELYQVSSLTELKILAGEQEIEIGYRAACYYGVDCVRWGQLVQDLKAFDFNNFNRNDEWHPNFLSGFLSALMMWMELYGEQPNIDIVTQIAKEEVWPYIDGYMDSDKKLTLSSFYTFASNLVLKK